MNAYTEECLATTWMVRSAFRGMTDAEFAQHLTRLGVRNASDQVREARSWAAGNGSL